MDLRLVLSCLFSMILCSQAAIDLGWGDDSDLTSFVTRPDIKAPLFEVQIHDPASISPGYWFVAPYAFIMQEKHASKYYQPCQTGPSIYDGNGDLVWSGACQFENQNTCDFRAWDINGTNLLSAIIYANPKDTLGRAVVMDNGYNVVNTLLPQADLQNFNMHELNLVDNGNRALFLTGRTEHVDTKSLQIPDQPVLSGRGWIANMGFREVDVQSGDTKFEWWAHGTGGVAVNESSTLITRLEGPYPSSWDWFHANSVVKNDDGDYLVSSRYTDTVYKISGNDGSIIWRLGGYGNSDFELEEGFNFSRQHDAQWVEYGEDFEVVSLLDNAADDEVQTSSYTSGLTIHLDKRNMSASVLRRWVRPDKQLSRLRGNLQRLPNGNVFAGWSDNCYISEHTEDDRVLMEARFASKRFVTYRAYKFNFTATPENELPILKAFNYGVDEESSTTVYYVSWNGATEVDRWVFKRDVPEADTSEIGSTKRKGFETMFQSKGHENAVYVEALDRNGTILARSETFEIARPESWVSGAADVEGQRFKEYLGDMKVLAKTEL